ncbi:hypothetical protein [Polyangium sp. 6x1]|uniref:hypothetical protein n=1 Tax=Polyangium sp. 6x1 TaxID=3042689 RepID=UPI0024824DEC|nr:hypothetical protein [Polyangium sp. 6x1]MDI1450016.1 hypothetical protein [Polyangium sp. 6x1]
MNIRKYLVAARLAVGTIATLTFSGPAQADHPPICGLVVFDRQQGPDTVYRGVAYGSITIVISESGRVVAAATVNVTPGGLIVLRPGQGFTCR